MQLIPSISVIKNRTVRLVQGNYEASKRYEDSPIDVAKKFEDHGITRVHFVDLEGAKEGTPINYHALEMIAKFTTLKVNYAGGVHTDGDMSKIWESGAESITSATVPVYDREMFSSWMMSYGREKIALGADVKDGFLRVGGWQKDTKIKLFDHVQFFYDRGLKYMKTTDINRDGTLEGPTFELYKSLVEEFPNLCVFASGGVRSMDDIRRLQDLGVYGVVFGKAYYEGKITIKELEDFISVK